MKKVLLINGTLGSGKTTLIRKLLRSTEFNGSWIIENEFASENIDGKVLKEHHTIEISGDCICCSSGEELHEALAHIAKKEDEKKVIIETTGVATATQVLQKLFLDELFLEKYHLLHYIYVLDPLEYKESRKQRKNDIALADTVILTKTDLVDNSLINEIKDDLAEITSAQIIESNKETQEYPALQEKTSLVERKIGDYLDNETEAHSLKSSVLYPAKRISKESILKLVKNMKLRGIKRIKGFFNSGDEWLHLEATPNHHEIEVIKPLERQIIVIIGQENIEDLEEVVQ